MVADERRLDEGLSGACAERVEEQRFHLGGGLGGEPGRHRCDQHGGSAWCDDSSECLDDQGWTEEVDGEDAGCGAHRR